MTQGEITGQSRQMDIILGNLGWCPPVGSSRGQVLTERTFPLCYWLHKTLLQRKPRKKGRFEQPSQFKQTTLCLTGKLRTSALVGGGSFAAHLRDAWGNQSICLSSPGQHHCTVPSVNMDLHGELLNSKSWMCHSFIVSQ